MYNPMIGSSAALPSFRSTYNRRLAVLGVGVGVGSRLMSGAGCGWWGEDRKRENQSDSVVARLRSGNEKRTGSNALNIGEAEGWKRVSGKHTLESADAWVVEVRTYL